MFVHHVNLERYGYSERLELLGRDDGRVDVPRCCCRTSHTCADGGADGGTEARAARELLTARVGLALHL